MNLFSYTKISLVQSSQASGTTTLTTNAVDMAGFDGVLFFGSLATQDPTNYIKAQEDMVSKMTNAADLAGTKVTADANAEVLFLDVYQPLARYVRLSVVRGVATATGDIYALQYCGRREPMDNVVPGTITGKVVATPIEGQA